MNKACKITLIAIGVLIFVALIALCIIYKDKIAYYIEQYKDIYPLISTLISLAGPLGIYLTYKFQCKSIKMQQRNAARSIRSIQKQLELNKKQHDADTCYKLVDYVYNNVQKIEVGAVQIAGRPVFYANYLRLQNPAIPVLLSGTKYLIYVNTVLDQYAEVLAAHGEKNNYMKILRDGADEVYALLEPVFQIADLYCEVVTQIDSDKMVLSSDEKEEFLRLLATSIPYKARGIILLAMFNYCKPVPEHADKIWRKEYTDSISAQDIHQALLHIIRTDCLKDRSVRIETIVKAIEIRDKMRESMNKRNQ